jgi:hypothetical protein
MVSSVMISEDADGQRADELCHGVEHAHSNGNFGRLGIGMTCPQARTRDRLEPMHRVLTQRTTVVTASRLPFVPTALSNGVDNFFALSCAGRGRRPVSCTFARRNRVRRDLGAVGLRVVCTVDADDIDKLVRRDLSKQFGPRFAVHDILARHEYRSQLVGVRVECEIDLAAGVAPRVSVLPDLLFAFAVDLHARVVHDQMQQFTAIDTRQLQPEGLRTTAHSRGVRHRQIGEGQIAQILRKAFQGAQWQRERCFQAKQYLNRCISVRPRVGTVSGTLEKSIIVIRVGMLLRLVRLALSVVKFSARYSTFSNGVAPLSLRFFSRAKIENLYASPNFQPNNLSVPWSENAMSLG